MSSAFDHLTGSEKMDIILALQLGGKRMKPHPVVVPAMVVFSLIAGSAGRSAAPDVFAKSNLVAWCIVPFDAAQRANLQVLQFLAGYNVGAGM